MEENQLAEDVEMVKEKNEEHSSYFQGITQVYTVC